MKLILTVLSDNNSDPVSQALITGGFRVTRIASTGGFFRRGSTTLLIGVADDQVDAAFEVIRQSAQPSSEPEAKRATLFVVNVEHFLQV